MSEQENTNPVDGAAETAARVNQYYERPDETMRRYNIALTNALADEGILGELKNFNYDEARIQECMDLLNKTVELLCDPEKGARRTARSL